MANKGFIGTTCTLGGTAYLLTGLDISIDGQEVDVTDISKAAMIFEVGLPKYEITLDIVGGTTPSFGAAAAALAIAWFDGSVTSTANLPGKFITKSIKVGGKINDAIKSTVTLIPEAIT